MPETKVNLIFFDIKLKYLGLFYVLLSLIQIPFSNAGGNIAHLGGAFYGFYYAKNLNKSLNIPALEMLYKYFNNFSKISLNVRISGPIHSIIFGFLFFKII